MLWILFAGSLFLTSCKFIDAHNTPQCYCTLLLAASLLWIGSGSRQGLSWLSRDRIFWIGIFILVVLQALYGLLQYVHVLPPISRFALQGTLDNPAGFAAIEVVSLPVGFHLFSSTARKMKYCIVAGLFIVMTAVILSGSRTGIITMFLIGMLYLWTWYMSRQPGNICRWWLAGSVLLILCVILAAGLYRLNAQSASGRLLIWQVSWTMFKDRPFWGYGPFAFRSSYMGYQASFFAAHPDSVFSQLAGNVQHPFNEYIYTVVSFGLLGFFIVVFFAVFIGRLLYRHRVEYTSVPLFGLVAVATFALCSYPLHYAAVWSMLMLYVLPCIMGRLAAQHSRRICQVGRVVLRLGILAGLYFVAKDCTLQIRWKHANDAVGKVSSQQVVDEYKRLFSNCKQNPLFLYNYGAVLHLYGRYQESLDILTLCMPKLNDYDVQVLMADNYESMQQNESALTCYALACDMIPCRFWPLYRMYAINRKMGESAAASVCAERILQKPVKVPSALVDRIKKESREYLEENVRSNE